MQLRYYEKDPYLNRDMAREVSLAGGNTYDFAFGLNWKGVISDERTKRYGPKA